MIEKEERISYDNARLIETIEHQLAGIDRGTIMRKKTWIEQQSLMTIQKNIQLGYITYEELVAYYLISIKEIDQSQIGCNAMSEINPYAMEQARYCDLYKKKVMNQLYGIPVVVKENINTKDMPTSAGTYALKDFIPATDAPIVSALKQQGAIILGKTNLSELSYWMSSKSPSGYSAKKGQTLNPFAPLAISPLGSSSGSAVAMATDLATLSIGTETIGSIVAPACVNSVVGYKPTRETISGEGIVPITYALDTPGPITKTVEDAIYLYQAIGKVPCDVVFDKNFIKGKRIGLLETETVFDASLKQTLAGFAVEIVPVQLDVPEEEALFILYNDFERDLNHYLTTYHSPIKSLKELIAFNKQDEQRYSRYGQDYLEESSSFNEKNDKRVQTFIQKVQKKLRHVLQTNHLDVLVVQGFFGVAIAGISGCPEITVPFGKLDKQPIGVTFLGDRLDDANLLSIAYSFEQLTQLRQLPDVNGKHGFL